MPRHRYVTWKYVTAMPAYDVLPGTVEPPHARKSKGDLGYTMAQPLLAVLVKIGAANGKTRRGLIT